MFPATFDVSRQFSCMQHELSAIERAFQLAKMGGFSTLPQILQVLKAENYGTGQITGPMLHKQLKALIEEAKAKPRY